MNDLSPDSQFQQISTPTAPPMWRKIEGTRGRPRSDAAQPDVAYILHSRSTLMCNLFVPKVALPQVRAADFFHDGGRRVALNADDRGLYVAQYRKGFRYFTFNFPRLLIRDLDLPFGKMFLPILREGPFLVFDFDQGYGK
ncbi:MAG: hypothetical protein RSE12_17165 [Fuscovulum sp.]|nr:MAG: hypothetical protein RSE12_17165 [Fuscovulum sp.]